MIDRRAFTLLELLLATALTTLLMVGVLAIISRIGAAAVVTLPGASAEDAASDDVIDALVHLLREDIDHAFDVDTTKPNELIMFGVGTLEGDDRQRGHRPVVITYQFERAGSRMWLVRRQAALDVLSNRNVQRDLVCEGIARFALTAARDGQVLEGASAARRKPIDAAPPPPAIDAVGGTVESPPPDPYESILVDGLMFYRRYAPVWASASEDDADERPAAMAGKPKVADGRLPEGDKSPADLDLPGVIWRLRVWTDGEADRFVDRLITIQRSEGR